MVYTTGLIVSVALPIGLGVMMSVLVVVVLRCIRKRRTYSDFPPPFPPFRDEGELPNSSQRTDDVERQVERENVSTVDKRIESSTTAVREYRKRAYRGKENGVGTYLNKVLQVLFMVFGLLTVTLSVVLDNSFNHESVRFIPFGILAPFTIFFGFLASGWFPRVPLRLIAFLKRRGFLRNVMPCSPWHDNVVTDFSDMICTLEQTDSGTSHLPQVLQTFLYGDQGTVITQSTLALERTSHCQGVSTLNADLQDISIQNSVPDTSASRQSEGPTVMTTGKAPSQVEETVDQSPIFHVSDDGHILTFSGPTIRGLPLEVQVSKNTSFRDTFDLSCTFRNKISRRMYLNTQRLHNLAENMVRWVENPHPIVVDEFSDILHCMPIRDILWEFTKSLYTMKPLHVQHRFLGCLCDDIMEQIAVIALVAVTSLLALIPLISDTRSLFYLFLAAPILVYVFIVVARRLNAHHLINYYFKSLLCPLFIKVYGFSKLYKCKSFYIWCNEFRKERVFNPEYFLINQVTANRLFEDGETCFDVGGSVGLPDSFDTNRGSPITLECEAGPFKNFKKLHDYKLEVIFDDVRDGCYIDVRLSFYGNNDLLDNRYFYKGSTQVEKLQLVEKVFSYYSDPSFGGYVETIHPCCRSYLGHCPRFLDVCNKIISENPTPILLVANRKPDANLIIGDSFLSVKAE